MQSVNSADTPDLSAKTYATLYKMFGRIEPWRIAGRMPKAKGKRRQFHLLRDFGKPLMHTHFHFLP